MKGAKAYVAREGRTPTLVRMVDVEPQEVEWLWYPYIPIGKLTILEGDPGLGKTFIALTLVGIITKGKPWPYQPPEDQGMSFTGARNPGNALYLTAEDGLADTLRPRLDAAGADPDRVIAVKGWSEVIDGKETAGMISLADRDLLDKALTTTKPRLVIIDPLQAYLGAKVDMHRANEVRPLLQGLSELAEKHQCAIIAIRHLGKSFKGRAIYAGLGSIDFSAAARSILLVGQHNEKRIIAHAKSSLAPAGKSISYDIQDGALVWCGLTDVTPEQMLSTPIGREERSTRAAAQDFLETLLAEGPVASREVLRAAREAGIAKRTLERTFKNDLKGECKPKKVNDKLTWFWLLPGQSLKDVGEVANLSSNPVQDDTEKVRHDGELKEGLANLGGKVRQEEEKVRHVANLRMTDEEGISSKVRQVRQPFIGNDELPPELEDLQKAVETGRITGPLDMGYLKHPDVRTYVQGAFKRLGRYGPEDILGRAARRDLAAVARHYGVRQEGTAQS